MSQLHDEKGKVIPVTVVEVEPNVIVQVKSKEKDGYQAVQVGTGKQSKATKAKTGHLKGLGNFRFLREYKDVSINGQELKVGDSLDISMFVPGDTVKISGISKGKGFAGAVKRHGFAGMPSSHGHKASKRHIGSIGQRFPQHTLKGKRMAGHMGNERVTTRGLKVITVDTENRLLAVRGAVPGNNGGLVEITAQ